ncbi:MAG: hypothetical protein AAFN93_23270, partial [Bacteroidota bacterium]
MKIRSVLIIPLLCLTSMAMGQNSNSFETTSDLVINNVIIPQGSMVVENSDGDYTVLSFTDQPIRSFSSEEFKLVLEKKNELLKENRGTEMALPSATPEVTGAYELQKVTIYYNRQRADSTVTNVVYHFISNNVFRVTAPDFSIDAVGIWSFNGPFLKMQCVNCGGLEINGS